MAFRTRPRHVLARRRRGVCAFFITALVGAVSAGGITVGLRPGLSSGGLPADKGTGVAVAKTTPARQGFSPVGRRWRTVLERLDARRGAAWRRGRPGLLAAVYQPGSASLTADRAMLAAYERRGLSVDDVRLRIGAVAVVARGPRWVHLDVVDQLSQVWVRTPAGVARPLPRDRPSYHRIVLHRVGDDWRIGSIALSQRRI